MRYESMFEWRFMSIEWQQWFQLFVSSILYRNILPNMLIKQLFLKNNKFVKFYIFFFLATNACFSNPCLNGGTCNVDNSGKYNCACPKLYNGQNCNLCKSRLNKIYYPFCLRFFF